MTLPADAAAPFPEAAAAAATAVQPANHPMSNEQGAAYGWDLLPSRS
jgi:hypothetical protein